MNNLKQLALAHSNYAQTFGSYPSMNGFLSTSPMELRYYSVFTQLLPQIEQQNTFNAINFDVPLIDRADMPMDWQRDPIGSPNRTAFGVFIDVLVCPSDSLSYATTYHTGPANYRANVGAGHPIQRPSHEAGPFSRLGSPASPAGVADGLSTTASFSERLRGPVSGNALNPRRDILVARMHYGMDPMEALEMCPYQEPALVRRKCCAGSVWAIGSLTQTNYNHLQAPNSRTPDCGLDYFMPMQGRIGARSDHPGQVCVSFCDGSVRPVRNNIQVSVWKALGTAAGGEIVSAGDY